MIVAHPDDETLWAGGTILMHPEVCWDIITITRKSDAERSGKFFDVIERLGARGVMGDLDDGPEQNALDEKSVQEAILDLLEGKDFDLIFTHDFCGEYTRHLRHEETCKAVIDLWKNSEINAKDILRFAYEDGGRSYLPRAIEYADAIINLPKEIWQEKYRLVTECYGFTSESFEAKTTPKQEAFWSSLGLLERPVK